MNHGDRTVRLTGELSLLCALASLSPTVYSADVIVGDTTTATYTNTSLQSINGNLILGNQASGNGTYTITGNSAQTVVSLASPPETPNGSLIVGNAGVGSFTQGAADLSDPGNQVTVAGDLTLGSQFGSLGTYTLNTGSLTVAGMITVADLGQGTFTETGGSASGGSMTIANSDGTPNPLGVYNLNGTGQLSISGNETVGELGNGTFNQGVDLGGATTHAVGGTLTVGDGPLVTGDPQANQRQGTYNLVSGTLSTGGTVVGNQGVGFFNQSGGTQTVNGTLTLGAQNTPVLPCASGCTSYGGPAQGTYALSAGTLTTTGMLVVGDAGAGTLSQTGGVLQVAVGGPAANLIVGAQQGSTGSYSLSGGGTATVTGNLIIGRDGSNGTTAAAGTVTIGTLGAGVDPTNLGVTDTIVVASGGTGGLTQDSGTVTSANVSIGGGGGVDGGGIYPDGGTGTYTLAGGFLTSSLIEVGHAGMGTLTQTGGTTTIGVAGTTRGNLLIGGYLGATGTYNLGDVTNGAPTLQVYGDVTLGHDATATGNLTIAGDGSTMSVNQYMGLDSHNGGNMLIGLNGISTVMQTDASTVYLDHNMVLGVNAGSNGTYTLNATSLGGSSVNLSVGGDLEIGGMIPDIYGVNFQTAANGGTGTFNLQSGDVATVGAVNIGNNGGVGLVTQTGGTMTVSNGMSLGQGGGTGEYDLKDGTLNVTGTAYVSGNSNGTFNQTGGAFTADYLNVGILDGGTGTYTMSGGTLHTTGDLGVGGQNSQGNFTQLNGVVQVDGALYVNNDNTGSTSGGNYTISAGALTVNGTAFVGNASDGAAGGTGGVFTQNDGTVSIGNNLIVGNDPGGTGTYTMSGGTLHTTGSLAAGGQNSQGAFTQLNGVVQVDESLYVNNDNTGSTSGGNYTISAGALTVNGTAFVGNASDGAAGGTGGVFTQNGGTVSIGNNLIVGNNAGDNGSYTIGSGNLNIGTDTTQAVNGAYGSPAESLVVGNIGGATGTFTQNGASVTIGADSSSSSGNPLVQDLVLGSDTGSSGTYYMKGGTLTVYGNASFGNSSIEVGFTNAGFTGAGTGLFVQTGGAVSTDGVNGVAIGDAYGGSGEYDISGGTLTINANPTVANNSFDSNSSGNLFVGAHESGTLKQTGGSVLIAGDAFVALSNGVSGQWTINDSGGTGEPTVIIGGNLYVGGTPSQLLGGTTGTGEVDQTAGSVNIVGTLEVGAGNGSGGTYNLSGGTLNDTLVLGDAGTGIFNNTGGSATSGTPGVGGQGGIEGDVVIGAQATGQGTYSLGKTGQSTTPNLTVNGSIIIGRDLGSNAATIPTSTNGTRAAINPNLVIAGDGTSLGVHYNGGSPDINPASSDIIVGLNGNGAVAQTDRSTVYTDGAVALGVNSGSVGSYDLNATQFAGGIGSRGVNFHVGQGLEIGGVVNYPNSANPQTTASGGTGIFNLNSGSLETVGNIDLGNTGGTGYFNQTGGNVYIGGGLDIANADGTGTYAMNGGSLTATSVIVGSLGGGVLTVGGGATGTGAGILSIGQQGGGIGTMTVTGVGSTWTNGQQVQVGTAGTGTLNILAGANFESLATGSGSGSAGGLGDLAGSTGTVTVSGIGSTWDLANGALRVGISSVGPGNGAQGNLLNIANSGTVIDNPGNGSDGASTADGAAGTVGWRSGSVGTVMVTGTGSTWTNNGDLVVGDAGTGTVTQGSLSDNTVAGGAVSVTGNLFVGNQASGTYNLMNGTLTVAGNMSTGDTGNVNVAGGSLSAAGVNNSGTLNFSGGSITLSAGSGKLTNNATGQVNFLGTGTPTVTGNVDNFGAMTLNTNAQVTGILNNFVGGTITLNANKLSAQSFTNAGMLDIGIAGLADSGVLSSGGAATLGGTLNLDFLGGYLPTVGSTFEVMSFSSETGVFENSSWTFDGVTVTPEYNATNVTLDVTNVAAVPEPETWGMIIAGLALVGFASRQRRA